MDFKNPNESEVSIPLASALPIEQELVEAPKHEVIGSKPSRCGCRCLLTTFVVITGFLIVLMVVGEMGSGSGGAGQLTATPTNDSIAVLRARQLQLCRENPDLYDADDIEFITLKDTLLRMTLRVKPDMEAAVALLDETMRWRKEFGVARLSAADIPCEVFELNGTAIVGRDLDGDPVSWTRVKFNLATPGALQALDDKKRAFMHESLMKAGYERATVISDFGDCGVSNFQVAKVAFFLKLVKYYPGQVKVCAFVNMPWLLRFVAGVVNRLASGLNFNFLVINQEELTNFVAQDQLPKYIGGSSPVNFSALVEGCVSWRERLPDYLTREDMEEFMRERQHFYDIIEQERSGVTTTESSWWG